MDSRRWRWFYLIILLCGRFANVVSQDTIDGSGDASEPEDQENGDGDSSVMEAEFDVEDENPLTSLEAVGRSPQAVTCPDNTCHEDGGECVRYDSVQVFECKCRNGYTGQRCDVPPPVDPRSVHPCVPNPCQNGGSCRVNPGGVGFLCRCAPGFSGQICTAGGFNAGASRINPCFPNPCPGACTVVLNRYLCDSPIGGGGSSGGVIRTLNNPCVPNPCRNRATCNVRPGGIGFKCFCQPTYTGTYCEQQSGGGAIRQTNPCVPNPCRNGATCNVRPGGFGFRCFCAGLYTGTYCEQESRIPVTNPCVPNPCRNGATCNVRPGGVGFRCFCAGSYTGTYCEQESRIPVTNPCVPNPCRNRATCNVRPGGVGFRCFCAGSYIGTYCEQESRIPVTNPCVPNPCRNGATCNVRPGGVGFKCFCANSYQGTYCEQLIPTDPCIPPPCNNGRCTSVFGRATCECYPGWTGLYCNLRPRTPCMPNPCLNGGRCNANPNAQPDYKCYCMNGYSGQTCQIAPNPCLPNPCLNGGTCNNDAGTPFCYCGNGYTGSICQTPPNPCSPNPCRNGGTCNVNGNSFVCFCPVGYQGTYCDPIPNNPCLPNPCRNGGTCNVNGNSFVCFCPVGYQGALCDPIPKNPCLPNPCRNGGTCNVNGNSFVCFCPVGYQGPLCDPIPKNPCLPNPCRNGGTCNVNGNSFICFCAIGYQGTYCDPIPKNPCLPNPCRNGGTCNVNGKYFICYCAVGWKGQTCTEKKDKQTDPCNPSPCKGGCICNPSCRHADGYYCRGTNGLLGKNCGIPAPVITCGNNAITVSINAAIVNEYDGGIGGYKMFMSPSHSMNPQPTCPASVQSGQYTFTLPLPFTNCGTRVNQASNGKTQVSNYVWINRLIGNGIADMPVPIIHFICDYEKQYSIVTSLKPSIDTPPTIINQGSKSNTANIELCKSGSACPNKCPVPFALSSGAIYTVGEKIHLLFTPFQPGSTFTVQDLFLSCSPDTSTTWATAPVTLITGGCLPVGSNKYLPTTVRPFGRAVCVSFPVPMISGCQQFYIHAKLQPCSSVGCFAPISACLTTQGRRKRSEQSLTSALEDSSTKFEIFGPIFVIDGHSGIATEIMYPGEEYVNSSATGILILKDKSSEASIDSPASTSLPLHIALGVLLFMAVIIFSVLAAHNWHYINAHCGRKF